MSETWKPIPSAPGYEASDLGRIRSVDRTIVDSLGRVRRIPGVTLTPARASDGRHLTVAVGSPRRHVGVHRLVLEAFVGPCPERHEGCHRDDVADNNRLDNLYWGTRSDNLHDMVRNGRHPWANKTECDRGHAFTEDNLYEQTTGGRGCRQCRRENAAAYRQRAESRPAPPPCTFTDCDRPQRARGLCVGHLAQESRGREFTPLRTARRAA